MRGANTAACADGDAGITFAQAPPLVVSPTDSSLCRTETTCPGVLPRPHQQGRQCDPRTSSNALRPAERALDGPEVDLGLAAPVTPWRMNGAKPRRGRRGWARGRTPDPPPPPRSLVGPSSISGSDRAFSSITIAPCSTRRSSAPRSEGRSRRTSGMSAPAGRGQPSQHLRSGPAARLELGGAAVSTAKRNWRKPGGRGPGRLPHGLHAAASRCARWDRVPSAWPGWTRAAGPLAAPSTRDPSPIPHRR